MDMGLILSVVIPAKAGIQKQRRHWIPAFAGMTLLSILSPAHADDQASNDAMMKAVALEAGGKVDASDRKLFEQSIESTKESIARQTLDVFYRDALDFYHTAHYAEAQELLDKIYSIDPYYEDVATLRETVGRLKSNHDFQSKRGILEDFMRKGNKAQQQGKNIVAIGLWKQALQVNPSYEPAKAKIQEVNHQLAQKQYEAGYLFYHAGNMEEALDRWSNAIAVDPTYKQRGLLLLMSKVQLNIRRGKIAQLTAQANEQFAQNDLVGAVQTNDELLDLDPRNEPARRLAAKLRIQLGQAAFQGARESLNQHMFARAIKQYQESIKYGYEVARSQKGIQEAEEMVQSDKKAKEAERAPKQETAAAQPVPTSVPPPPAPGVAVEEANKHYRQGLAAIRSKDMHRAVEELEIASQLNPNDEHIYVAKERAKQEWAASNSGRSVQ
jgi:tetratricopeptide (TPR) repeat protein